MWSAPNAVSVNSENKKVPANYSILNIFCLTDFHKYKIPVYYGDYSESNQNRIIVKVHD